ncbi:DUF4350 domain-containing protein [Candidatus Viridilinea mediisalina]|uniref:DUF4350 domain-containing protein n=1 Tax=Candidatus Viridilinea mediisalina TaxID=2024553 RepID=A0A2A6RJY0_9CHLR|nr:DUF4350 domain-containing protein [Candidatus Viridilinea mediisalina]PDW03168.1 hypothetical protein CJ255_10165 [Candidatus Viridilinea mediisalina]
MKRRDTIVIILTLLLLTIVVGLTPQQDDESIGGASSFASRPGGALALFRWWEKLGYRVDRLAYREFALNPSVDLLVVLAPRARYSAEHAALVRDWVAAGGTVLIAESRANAGATPLLEAFGLGVAPLPEDQPFVQGLVLQPALGDPPIERLSVPHRAIITSEEPGRIAPLVGSNRAPTIIGMQHGEGYVYASATVEPFTNQGLRNANNGALVLNLLRRIPAGGVILFDEVHHGFVGQNEANLRALLFTTTWGWAVLYASIVAMLYLLLTSRRFGRAVPLRAEADRRSSAEYLSSMAGLLRRGGKRGYALEHYRTHMRRRLARAHGLSPDLDDGALVAALAETRPALARQAADLLARMAHAPNDEATMLRLVAEADALGV